ncbi:MAG: hypothetical protein WCK76_08560 [Elusimicrobiota bacterium]
MEGSTLKLAFIIFFGVLFAGGIVYRIAYRCRNLAPKISGPMQTAAAVMLGCLAALLLLIAILRAIGMPQRAPRFIKDAALILFPVSSHPRIGRH